MTQQISPFIESKYGWAFGESGWNGGMDENLLKFSFLFDRNIDGIVSSLPPVVNGKAYFNTVDSRIYFAVNLSYYSTPVPLWFTVVMRSSGINYQFNGTTLVVNPIVTSVSGKTGDVSLVVADIAGAAPLVSPTFTGLPKAPTLTASDSSTSIATTAFVKTQNYLQSSVVGQPLGVAGLDVIGKIPSSQLPTYYTDNMSTMAGLVGSADGQIISMSSYYPGWSVILDGPVGGHLWIWNSSLPKTYHNGGSVRSPTVPWNGTMGTISNFLAGTGETDPTGSGCWVDPEATNLSFVERFGARPGNSSYAVGNYSSIRAAVSASLTHYPVRLEAQRKVIYGHGEYFITGNSVLMPNHTQMIALPGNYRYRGGIKHEGMGKTATILTLVSAGTGETWFYDTTDPNFPGDTSVAYDMQFDGITFRGTLNVRNSIAASSRVSGFNMETYGFEKFITWSNCTFEWLDRVVQITGYGNGDHNRMTHCHIRHIREDVIYLNNNQAVALTMTGVDVEEIHGICIKVGPQGGGDLSWTSGSVILYPEVDVSDTPLVSQRQKGLLFWDNSGVNTGPSSGGGNNKFTFRSLRIENYAASQAIVFSFRTGTTSYGSLDVVIEDSSFVHVNLYAPGFPVATTPQVGVYTENDLVVRFVRCAITFPYTFTVSENTGRLYFDNCKYIPAITSPSTERLASACTVTSPGGSIVARGILMDSFLVAEGDFSRSVVADFTKGITGMVGPTIVAQGKHPSTPWPQPGVSGTVQTYLPSGSVVKSVHINKPLDGGGTTVADYALNVTSNTGTVLGTTGVGVSNRAITTWITLSTPFVVPAAPNNYLQLTSSGSTGSTAFSSTAGNFLVDYI